VFNWLNPKNIAVGLRDGVVAISKSLVSLAGSVKKGQYDPLIFDKNQNSANNAAHSLYDIAEQLATFVVVPWATKFLADRYYGVPYKNAPCKAKVAVCNENLLHEASVWDVAKLSGRWFKNLWVMQPLKSAMQGLSFMLGSPLQFMKHQLFSQVLYHTVLKHHVWSALKPAAIALMRPPLERILPLLFAPFDKGDIDLSFRDIFFSMGGEGTLLTTLTKPLVGFRSLYRFIFNTPSVAAKIAPNLYEFSENATDVMQWMLVTTLGFFKGIGAILPAIGSGPNGVTQAISDAMSWISERFSGVGQAFMRWVFPTLLSWTQWFTKEVPQHIWATLSGGAKFVNNDMMWKFAEKVGELAPDYPYVPNVVYGVEAAVLAVVLVRSTYKAGGYIKPLAGWGCHLIKTSAETLLDLTLKQYFSSPSTINTNINQLHTIEPIGAKPAVIYNQIHNNHQINNQQGARANQLVAVPGAEVGNEVAGMGL